MIPEWTERSLEELCLFRRELITPVSNGTRRYVGLEHLDPGNAKIARFGGESEVRSTKHRFCAGDILYGKLRPYLDKAAVAEWDGVCSTDILVFQPKDGVADSCFLGFFVHTMDFVQHAVATTDGVNHPRTSWSGLSGYRSLVPPLPEQRAIASVLSKIQAAVEVQDRTIATLRELKAATMAKLFREGLRGEKLKQTEIGEMPESWEVARIGQVFEIQQGKALSPKARRGVSPRPFLRTANVSWSSLDLAELDRMDFSDEEVARLALQHGDLLVCEGGEIGRSAIWRNEVPGCLYQNHVHRLRRSSDGVEPQFVAYWMQEAFTHLGVYGGVGNRTTIPNLSGTRLKALPIPLAPVPEQRAIASVLSSIQAAQQVHLRRRDLLSDVFSSMLHLLMVGRVRVTPIMEERASNG